jgi:hypothetical protein
VFHPYNIKALVLHQLVKDLEMDRMLLNVLLFVSWLVVNAAESADPLTSNSESDNKAVLKKFVLIT